jgi:hypothetical protein
MWKVMLCLMTKQKVKLYVMQYHIVSSVNDVYFKIRSDTCIVVLFEQHVKQMMYCKHHVKVYKTRKMKLCFKSSLLNIALI